MFLLTVSGTIDPAIHEQTARGERPRADYVEMARGFKADLLDYAGARGAAGWFGRLVERLLGANVLLAWTCWQQRATYRVIVTDGEQVGIPLALLFKLLGRGPARTKHAMIVHTLSVPKKMVFFDVARVQSHIDHFYVYSTWQQHFIQSRWRIPADRVRFTPFMVDSRFFAPERVASRTPSPDGIPTICAVGLERRDYPTLLDAVRDLPVRLVVAAASPWSKQADGTQAQSIPANVTVCKLSQFALRQLYADSALLVMPLQPVTFQAGVTALLEAMAMARAVICSRTPGQTDVLEDGVHGLYVPTGDVAALRTAILHLCETPDVAARYGANGRARVLAEMNLDRYVERLTHWLHELDRLQC